MTSNTVFQISKGKTTKLYNWNLCPWWLASRTMGGGGGEKNTTETGKHWTSDKWYQWWCHADSVLLSYGCEKEDFPVFLSKAPPPGPPTDEQQHWQWEGSYRLLGGAKPLGVGPEGSKACAKSSCVSVFYLGIGMWARSCCPSTIPACLPSWLPWTQHHTCLPAACCPSWRPWPHPLKRHAGPKWTRLL